MSQLQHCLSARLQEEGTANRQKGGEGVICQGCKEAEADVQHGGYHLCCDCMYIAILIERYKASDRECEHEQDEVSVVRY